MASCKDCLHYDVCGSITALVQRVILAGDKADKRCGLFKPTADVVEVKHGEWKKQQFIGRSGFFSVKDFTCSNCFENFAVEQGKGLMNYCPYCGAIMDGRKETDK